MQGDQLSEEQDIFRRAVSARDEGEFGLAERLLLSLIDRKQEKGAYYAVLGHVRWKLGDREGAVNAFRNATRLAPRSEVCSLGLFHTLWESERADDAFAEMKRFITDHKSNEYTRLISDLKEEFGLDP